ncbi:MAG TPA: pyrimidine dimer DNA glycosylase/endonuclease V [Elusimicrobiota bacterium]|nr:pyrimidine dimer DNA glycosylase/endonuclease V [Elusimicrobiota bacterium]
MRIWDLPPWRLCRAHLLGEHRELHAVWNIITRKKSGYSRHPETLRWKGKLRALYGRHDELVEEMGRRGYEHRSPLRRELAAGAAVQKVLLASLREQRARLGKKNCGCRV